MNLFSKGNGSLADAVSIELQNEPDWYTSGARVRGQAVVSSRLWAQMQVEVVIVCEEHAELDADAASGGAEGYEFRRLTVAGETVEGEPAAPDAGTFPFELRILDDAAAPFLLPSFDVDGGEQGLVNAVRWLVEVRVEHKGRLSKAAREIAFLPARPRPAGLPPATAVAQKAFTQDLPMRAYEPVASSSAARKLTPKALRAAPVQQFHEAVVVGQLHLPEQPVEQAPAALPLRLSVAASHPHLLAVTRIEVQLVQVAEARIGGQRSTFVAREHLIAPRDDVFITLEESILDLSSYVPRPQIANACPNFGGRWLSMRHFLQTKLSLCAIHRPEYSQVLKLSGPVIVLPPRAPGEHIDAPPQYTPPLYATPPEAAPPAGNATPLMLSLGQSRVHSGLPAWLTPPDAAREHVAP